MTTSEMSHMEDTLPAQVICIHKLISQMKFSKENDLPVNSLSVLFSSKSFKAQLKIFNFLLGELK